MEFNKMEAPKVCVECVEENPEATHQEEAEYLLVVGIARPVFLCRPHAITLANSIMSRVLFVWDGPK